MFKLKNLAVVLSIAFIGLSSCSKDSDSDSATGGALEGKWQFTKEGVVVNNQEVLDNYAHTSGCTKDYTEILAGNIIRDHYFDNPNCQETIDVGTWTRSNNNLVFTFPDDNVTSLEILELTSTTLKVKMVDAGVIYITVLTRIQ